MTDDELLSLDHITVSDAARYLQNEFSPQHLRMLAQAGRCPFCVALKHQRKWSYHINAGRLQLYKHGELMLSADAGT